MATEYIKLTEGDWRVGTRAQSDILNENVGFKSILEIREGEEELLDITKSTVYNKQAYRSLQSA